MVEQKDLIDQARWTRLPNGSPLSITTSGQTYYYFQDASGNVRGLLNSSGAFAAEYVYYPFGEDRSETGSVYNPLRFAASFRDVEGGAQSKTQCYMMARYYDPAYRRFIKGNFSDPAFPTTGNMLGPHMPMNYAYAANSPTTFGDPRGASLNGTLRSQTVEWLPG